jgi:hypothetical protein
MMILFSIVERSLNVASGHPFERLAAETDQCLRRMEGDVVETVGAVADVYRSAYNWYFCISMFPPKI